MIVYLVTNLINGKRYVGQTQRSLSQRWSRHLTAARRGNTSFLAKAIRKHGEQSFSAEVICSCSGKDELDDRERAFIRLLNTRSDTHGYNLTDGGEGSFGYKHTPESCRKISAMQTGKKRGPRPPRSTEWCNKISEAKKGKAQSEKQLLALKRARKARAEVGWGPVSLETRHKMSESAKRRRNVKI